VVLGSRRIGPRERIAWFFGVSAERIGRVVGTSEQMGNRLLGFVAHVGQAEGLTLDCVVAEIDDDAMSFSIRLRTDAGWTFCAGAEELFPPMHRR